MFLKALRNEILVPVVSAVTGMMLESGAPAGQKRIPIVRKFVNTAWEYFFPGEPVVILDWNGVDQHVRSEVKQFRENERAATGSAITESDLLNEAIFLEVLDKPVTYDGTDFLGNVAWSNGSIKEKRVLGLPRDVLGPKSEGGTGMMTSCVHSVYGQPALLPVALYGSGVYEKMKILLLPEGAEFAGHTIADGFGLLNEDHVDAMRDHDVPLIALDRPAKNSYMMAQRLDWDIVGEEVAKHIHRHNEHLMASPIEWELEYMDARLSKYKHRLLKANEMMYHHPYCQASNPEQIAQMMAELAYSLAYMHGKTRLAVPTSFPIFIYDPGVYIGDRSPNDSWYSIDIIDTRDAPQEELARVKSLQCNQYRLTAIDDSFFKGIAAAIPADQMQGYDGVFCFKDLKMTTRNKSRLFKKLKQNGRLELVMRGDSVMMFTASYEAGVAVGCPIEPFKKFGGDYDGDYFTIRKSEGCDALLDNIRVFPRTEASYKIPKVFGPIGERSAFLKSSFDFQIGPPTNLQSSSFITSFKGRHAVATKALGFEDGFDKDGVWYSAVEHMDMFLHSKVKNATDGTKTTAADGAAEKATVAKFTSKLAQYFNGIASWVRWKQRNEWAFRHGIPMFYDELSSKQQAELRDKSARSKRQESENLAHLPTIARESTIGKIYALRRPLFEHWFNKRVKQFQVFQHVGVGYLSDYAPLAGLVEDEYLDMAWQLKELWDSNRGSAHIIEQDWTVKDVADLRSAWQALCDEFAAKCPSRDYAAWALWRVCHHSRAPIAGAAAVFVGFPEECIKILKEQPGAEQNQYRSVVTGLHRNVIQGTLRKEYPVCRVTVKAVQMGSRMYKGVFAIGEFPKLQKVRTDGLPNDLIGTIAKLEPYRAKQGFVSPNWGDYTMRLKQISGGSYEAQFTRLETKQPA